MVIECLLCWWGGLSPVPIFFDVADLHHHSRTTHARSEYHAQEIIAAPWIAVGFTYQASFTETGELVLVYPYLPRESDERTDSDPVREAMSLVSVAPQRTLWA